MKLSEIEAVSPEDFVFFEDETAYSYTIDRGGKENAIEVDAFPKLYTADQMQEYAKALVYEALYKHTSFGTGKEELVKHITEEFFTEKILEEVEK